jgi:hypothetical protein
VKTFQLFDAGVNARPRGGDKDDCMVRALAVARGISYHDAWALLYAIQGEMMFCGLPLLQALRAKDARLGVVEQLDFPAVRGRPRMTGREFATGHRRGRFILRLARHVAAVKDGTVYDTFDSTYGCVYTAWRVQPFITEES